MVASLSSAHCHPDNREPSRDSGRGSLRLRIPKWGGNCQNIRVENVVHVLTRTFTLALRQFGIHKALKVPKAVSEVQIRCQVYLSRFIFICLLHLYGIISFKGSNYLIYFFVMYYVRRFAHPFVHVTDATKLLRYFWCTRTFYSSTSLSSKLLSSLRCDGWRSTSSRSTRGD